MQSAPIACREYFLTCRPDMIVENATVKYGVGAYTAPDCSTDVTANKSYQGCVYFPIQFK
jgi:hypothetical protein